MIIVMLLFLEGVGQDFQNIDDFKVIVNNPNYTLSEIKTVFGNNPKIKRVKGRKQFTFSYDGEENTFHTYHYEISYKEKGITLCTISSLHDQLTDSTYFVKVIFDNNNFKTKKGISIGDNFESFNSMYLTPESGFKKKKKSIFNNEKGISFLFKKRVLSNKKNNKIRRIILY